MKTIYSLLLCTLACFGQTTVFTETFSDYTPDTTSAYTIFDNNKLKHTNASDDSLNNNLALSGDDDSHDFFGSTWTGDLPDVYDSTTSAVGNPFDASATATATKYNDTQGNHSRTNNATGHHEPGTGDASFFVAFYNDGQSGSFGVAGKGGGNATNQIGYQFEKSTGNLITQVSDGSGTFVMNTTDAMLSGWNIAGWDWDRSEGYRYYLNGAPTDSNIAANTVDITNNAVFLYIGRNGGNTNNFDSYISYIHFNNFTTGKINAKELGFLPKNWNSQHGSITRARSGNNFVFYQSLSDTIAGAITAAGTLLDNQEWYVTLEAKSSATNKTMKAWLTGGSSASVTLTPTWSVYTLPLGRINIDGVGDSLHVASHNTSNQIDIDNITVYSQRHHLINRRDFGEF